MIFTVFDPANINVLRVQRRGSGLAKVSLLGEQEVAKILEGFNRLSVGGVSLGSNSSVAKVLNFLKHIFLFCFIF